MAVYPALFLGYEGTERLARTHSNVRIVLAEFIHQPGEANNFYHSLGG